MITTPEIICDAFSFLDKDEIESIQLVNKFWNNVIIHHKNILPLRQLSRLDFHSNELRLYADIYDLVRDQDTYIIIFDGTNLSKLELNESSRYSQLTVDEVLNNLNDVVFGYIEYYVSEDNLLNLKKLFTTKTNSRFRGQRGKCFVGRLDSKLVEVFDNYIIVDELNLSSGFYIREVCANPEIVQLPSTPKEIKLECLEFKENDEVLNFTGNGKLNGANRLTIRFDTSDTNFGNFIRQWFELYRTHQNPISLVQKFELGLHEFLTDLGDSVRDAVKTLLNNTQLRVKYSLEKKEFHSIHHGVMTLYKRLIRHCVLHETDSYSLVIEMEYGEITDMSSINASNLDQPPFNQMSTISFCVKSL